MENATLKKRVAHLEEELSRRPKIQYYKAMPEVVDLVSDEA